MEDFLTRVEKRGAYIALMEDLIGKEIEDLTEPAKESNNALKTICKKFDKELCPIKEDKYNELKKNLINRLKKGVSAEESDEAWNEAWEDICEKYNKELVYIINEYKYKLHVGLEGNGYFLEPCPIMHTYWEGLKGKSKVFDLIWIGLNPHYEPAYLPNNWSWKALSDYQIPKSKDEDSIYRRVSGEMGPAKDEWSKYYQWLFRFWYALRYNKIFSNWNDFEQFMIEDRKNNQKSCSMQDAFLDEFFEKHRMANLEFIPFKSKEISDVVVDCKDCILSKRYDLYQEHMIKFITQYAKDDSWIVFYGKTDIVERYLRKTKEKNNIYPSKTQKSFTEECQIKIGGNNIYAFRRGEKKVLLFPMIHARSYSYANTFALKNDLIKCLKEKVEK